MTRGPSPAREAGGERGFLFLLPFPPFKPSAEWAGLLTRRWGEGLVIALLLPPSRTLIPSDIPQTHPEGTLRQGTPC